MITKDAVIANFMARHFSKPIIENVVRGVLVEAMVNLALAPDGWEQQDAWGGCDFRHLQYGGLEVKQAAARQTWDATGTIKRKIEFDIAPRTGLYDATGWVEFTQSRRVADFYVFAYHPIADETADHREPGQWRFYVVPTSALPTTQKLTLRRLLWLDAHQGRSRTDIHGLARMVRRVMGEPVEPPPAERTAQQRAYDDMRAQPGILFDTEGNVIFDGEAAARGVPPFKTRAEIDAQRAKLEAQLAARRKERERG